MFIANIFGIGASLDIYFAAITFNLIIQTIATGVINSAITPILIKYYKNGEYKILKEFSYSFFNILVLVFLLFAIFQYIFADQILHVLLPGFDKEKMIIAIHLFRIQAFVSIVSILAALFTALHYTMKQFYRVIIYSMIGQIFQILYVWTFYKQYGIYSLVYGLIINQITYFILLGLSFFRYYKIKIVYNNELINAIHKIFPLIISSAFSKSNLLVDRFFASTLGSGSITLLHYGDKVIRTISGLINKGISVVTLREFSLKQDDEKDFKSLFYKVYKSMIFIVIPVTFLIIFFLKDALQLIVLSNKLSLEDIEKIYLVTVCLIGVFIGGSLNNTITNSFFAKGLTKIISKTNVILQIFGISFKVALFFILGFWGLPIAFSLNSILGIIVLFILFNKHIYKLNVSELSYYLLKVGLIASVAIILPKFVSIVTRNIFIVQIFICPILFLLLFAILSIIFEKEVSRIILSKAKILIKKAIIVLKVCFDGLF